MLFALRNTTQHFLACLDCTKDGGGHDVLLRNKPLDLNDVDVMGMSVFIFCIDDKV